MTHVGLELVFALSQSRVTLCVLLVGDARWKQRWLQGLSFEEWKQLFVQVDEVGIALVDDPRVLVLLLG